MSHARIEEVSDSDPSEGDISEIDDDFDEREILKARPSAVSKPAASIIDPTSIPSTSTSAPPRTQLQDDTKFHTTEDDSKYKDFQCIYPIYFDKNRTKGEGRRVGKEYAVENPMAREIVAACGRLRLETLFEPAKTHPKDWANPGRVKVKLKGGQNAQIKNSKLLVIWKLWKLLICVLPEHHLYTLISKHLLQNPTTAKTATLVRVPGVPPPDSSKPYPEPAVPKGWKMGNILPYYSPALPGDGVSENFFKDMMSQMGGAGGQLPPGMENMAALQNMMGGAAGPSGGGPGGGPGGAPKKEKKEKRKVIRG